MSVASDEDQNIGLFIKALLKEKMLSMRKLSSLTGIDTATISRIVNNKQKPTPSHLQQFAHHLDVPFSKLILAAGYNLELFENNDQSDMYHSIEAIQEILVSSNFLDHEFTMEKIHRELAKYEHFALTKEGEQKILKEFESKVEEVKGAGPFISELNNMFKSYCDENISKEKRTVLGSVLLYFILSTDIIPDYVFPFGYLDDCLAVQIGLERLSKIEENNC